MFNKFRTQFAVYFAIYSFLLSVSAFHLRFCPTLTRSALSMNSQTSKAILWDVDGTLADSSNLGYSSTAKVLQINGYPSITHEDYHFGSRYTTPDRFAWHVTGDPKAPIGEILGKQFDDLYVGMVTAETASFYPGISDLLMRYKAEHGENLHHGALSNACGAYVRAVLKENRVHDLFRVQLGADEVPAPKPHPHGLLQCCEALNVDPRQCIYIGDSPTDGQAAHAAGMPSIGVTWGSHPVESVKAAFTHTVHSVAELQDAIDQLLMKVTHRESV